jgi:hypothetical protein
VKLSIDGDLIEIYPTFADAENSIFGKKNNSLWFQLRKNNKEFVELKGFKWMLLDTYNKVRKVEGKHVKQESA